MAAGSSIQHRLEAARRDLLDLSARNRLVHTPRGRSRAGSLDIVGERSKDVFRILIGEQQAMGFLPSPQSEAAENGDSDEDTLTWLSQPENGSDDDLPDDAQAAAARYSDHDLQTRLTSDALQKRLLRIDHDAKTFEEEQGVNILYLALGFLKWYEDDRSDVERFAPLLLIPVGLNRRSANARFRVRWKEEELATNLSLQAKLAAEFGIALPDVPDAEELSPCDYFERVRQAVSAKSRWEVQADEMTLGFFSFAKFLMYRDLQPENWPEHCPLGEHPLVSALLDGGFRGEPPICGDDEPIDPLLQPLDMVHVTDADSSQTLAIEEVRRGRNLVIQGPPGTGKSQTIANAIAAAVKDCKKVLFVAEKKAALEVVKRRLDQFGLGDICLELHSHKANKRAVHQELERTYALGKPKRGDVEEQAARLLDARDRLNRHVDSLHRPLQPAELEPFFILGELVRLQAAGVPPPDFELPEAPNWSPAAVRNKLHLLNDAAAHAKSLGNPAEHPWRGVMLESVLPTDVERLRLKLPPLLAQLARLIEATQALGGLLHTSAADTAIGAAEQGLLGRRLAAAPAMDRASLANPVWSDRRQEIGELIAWGRKLASGRAMLEGVVAEVAWSADVPGVRRNLAAYGGSWTRWFHRPYREAQAGLRGILNGPAPKSLAERLKILDTLIETQNALWETNVRQDRGEVGRCAFGSLWRGAESDWPALERIDQWEAESREAGIRNDFRQLMATIDDRTALAGVVDQVAAVLKPLVEGLRALFNDLRLDQAAAFGGTKLNLLPLEDIQRRLERWLADPESLGKWIAYRLRWSKLPAEGLEALAERIAGRRIEPDAASDHFHLAYCERLIREAFRLRPELAEFDGQSHERMLAEFRRLDLERIAMARGEVLSAHYEGIPRGEFASGEMGLIQREMNKKRNHLPLRQLLKQAGKAVQAIKPVFMMSPISVAQYLEPGAVEFDLLLIDEASQVRPVDALGAIARARQVVVVGDQQQLPPTQFFDKLLAGERDDEEQDVGVAVSDMASVLGLCKAQGVPQRMLRWHYRSRHHSLIALSNHEFYDDRLFIVPSPGQGAGQGLLFHRVSGGVFDRGRSATNRIEARAVAQAAMRHARDFPHETLGVGAFSVAQRDAILDELELLRRQDKDVERFFAEGGEEPFFVKNLENIQGDERDVIFISVGYAKDASGFMAMGFGPLSSDGGERRLNVLITRARSRCEVFSSITADDIDLNRSKSRGAQAFKSFLSYAETGRLDVAQATGRDFDSEFERQVAEALRRHGHEVHAQVGVAGFFIDLAISDSEAPGRFVLGVECDGRAYHSSRSARDRDRLRQAVLEDRGWIIHRIWSTDWFHRPEEQLRRTFAAIETAKLELDRRRNSAGGGRQAARTEASEPAPRAPQPDNAQSQPAVQSVPYAEADFEISETLPIADAPPGVLLGAVRRVVEIEGPVHQDEIVRRLVGLWGGSRTGNRISDAVRRALEEAVGQGSLAVDRGFYALRDRADVQIRNRRDVKSVGLRKPDMLPPAEIQLVLCSVLAANLGAAVDDLTTETARLLGFKTTSAALREVILREVEQLLSSGKLNQRNDVLSLA